MKQTYFEKSSIVGRIDKDSDTRIKIHGGGFIKTNTYKTRGKYYIEFKIYYTGCTIGITSNPKLPEFPGCDINSYGINTHNRNWWFDNSASTVEGWNISRDDIVGFGIDLNDKKLNLYINGNLIDIKDIPNIKDKCYISVGSGGAYDGDVELITRDLKYRPKGFSYWDIEYKIIPKFKNQLYYINNNVIPINDNLINAINKYGIEDVNDLLYSRSETNIPMIYKNNIYKSMSFIDLTDDNFITIENNILKFKNDKKYKLIDKFSNLFELYILIK